MFSRWIRKWPCGRGFFLPAEEDTVEEDILEEDTPAEEDRDIVAEGDTVEEDILVVGDTVEADIPEGKDRIRAKVFNCGFRFLPVVGIGDNRHALVVVVGEDILEDNPAEGTDVAVVGIGDTRHALVVVVVVGEEAVAVVGEEPVVVFGEAVGEKLASEALVARRPPAKQHLVSTATRQVLHLHLLHFLHHRHLRNFLRLLSSIQPFSCKKGSSDRSWSQENCSNERIQ